MTTSMQQAVASGATVAPATTQFGLGSTHARHGITPTTDPRRVADYTAG